MQRAAAGRAPSVSCPNISLIHSTPAPAPHSSAPPAPPLACPLALGGSQSNPGCVCPRWGLGAGGTVQSPPTHMAPMEHTETAMWLGPHPTSACTSASVIWYHPTPAGTGHEQHTSVVYSCAGNCETHNGAARKQHDTANCTHAGMTAMVTRGQAHGVVVRHIPPEHARSQPPPTGVVHPFSSRAVDHTLRTLVLN